MICFNIASERQKQSGCHQKKSSIRAPFTTKPHSSYVDERVWRELYARCLFVHLQQRVTCVRLCLFTSERFLSRRTGFFSACKKKDADSTHRKKKLTRSLYLKIRDIFRIMKIKNSLVDTVVPSIQIQLVVREIKKRKNAPFF